VKERLLRAREVAEALDVSPETVLRWTRRGELPGVKLPSGAIRYRPEALDEWIVARATTATAGRGLAVTPSAAAEDDTVPSKSAVTPAVGRRQQPRRIPMPAETRGSVYKTRGGYGIRWPEDGKRQFKSSFASKTDARRWFNDIVGAEAPSRSAEPGAQLRRVL
jgi:excisionase family DNA binding protein